MKYTTLIFCAVFLFFGFSSYARAATYYVRADGTVTAANKANATSPNAIGTSLNMAQVNAATFIAGDQVLFSSQGGNFTTLFTVPSGGSGVGSEITYANVPSETPVITSSTGPIIYTNAKSNIKVLGFSLVYTGSSATYGVRIHGGSNVTVQNLSINMGGYGNNIFASISISNVLIDSVTLTNSGATVPSINIIGPSNSNITISNSSANTGVGIKISPTTNLTISNISSTKSVDVNGVTTGTISNVSVPAGSTSYGLVLTNSSNMTISDFTYAGSNYDYSIAGSNQIIINRFNATAGLGAMISTSNNITINDSHLSNTSNGFVVGTGAHDITYNNCTVDHSNTDGFSTQNDSYNITYNNCLATNSAVVGFHSIDTSNNVTCNNCKSDYNGSIGFVAQGSASNITYWNSEASYNGTINVVFNGAGFLPHDSATNVKCYYCIAHHNYTDGIGDVGTGTNFFYNSNVWANGYAIGDIFNGNTVVTPSTRGNIYMSANKSAGGITIKNTISGAAKPREITNAANSSLTILDFNLYKPIDDNKFYNTVDNSSNTSWTTYYSTNELNSLNSDPLFVNATGTFSLPTDFQLTALSSAIDAGTVTPNMTSTTVDYAGNPIYGTPDIGVYEYQPPHSLIIATPDTINTGAGARIYADGKFRDLGTVNATPASLKITPSGGSFAVYGATETRPAWLDVTNISNWTNTHKTWTEGNAVAGLTNTLHVVGDLNANKYYDIKLDDVLGQNITGEDCAGGVCKSNSSGEITFTYTGTYSDHTFDITEDAVAPTNVGISSIVVDSTSQLTILAQTAVDSGSGLHTAPYWFSEISGNTGGSSSTDWQTGTTFIDTDLSCGTQYTYKVKVRDLNGNESVFSDPVSASTNGCPSSGSRATVRTSPVIPVEVMPTSTPVVSTTSNTYTYNFGTTLLKNGSRGEAVKELQRFFNTKLNSNLIIDGIFGPKTLAIVKQWQKDNSLVVDGLVGPKTKAKMNAEVN